MSAETPSTTAGTSVSAFAGHGPDWIEVGRGGPDEDAWGRSDSFDPDNVGDIADEGAGHRG
jgi:hypothetical protein